MSMARIRVRFEFILSSILYKRRKIYKYIFLIIYKVYKRKMVTQSYKIGNTERGFARKNGNTEFEKTQKW